MAEIIEKIDKDTIDVVGDAPRERFTRERLLELKTAYQERIADIDARIVEMNKPMPVII